LAHGLAQLRQALNLPPDTDARLAAYMELALQCVLEKHRLLMPGDEEATRRAELALLLSWLKVNVVVDHHATKGAPVVVEDNPVFNNLFGSIALAADGGGRRSISSTCVRAVCCGLTVDF
jgi:hypothetical protein